MHRFFLLILALLALPLTACASVSPPTEVKRIALTFDDIPRMPGAFMTPDERATRLRAGLREAGVEQAAFFVNPGQLDQRPGGMEHIRGYVADGHVLANHTAIHSSLTKSSLEDYLADIDAAAEWLASWDANRPWFRYPYLNEGRRDIEKRDAVRQALAERGLTNGYVTVDASDWFYEQATIAAARDGREMDMEALRDLYVESHVESAEFFDGLARRTIGRSPAHVMLLHETDLTALYIGDLVAALEAKGWTIITADEAYQDPFGELAATYDTPSAQGTLTEQVAWERGLPAPRWYVRNNTKRAKAEFDRRVLGLEADIIPSRFQGVWDYEDGTCVAESDLRMHIKAREITFYESYGTVSGVRQEGDDAIVDLAMEGEGETWEQSLRLSLVAEGEDLRLHTSDPTKPKEPDDLPRKRCE